MVRNNYAYLGFLGLVGLIGFWFTTDFWYLFFCVFFIFFAFFDMIPDELFQQNVRRAAWRALMVYLVLTVLAMMLLCLCYAVFLDALGEPGILWATEIDPFGYIEVYGPFLVQLALGALSFQMTFFITICVFCFTVLYFNHKEKKVLAQAEVEDTAEEVHDSKQEGNREIVEGQVDVNG